MVVLGDLCVSGWRVWHGSTGSSQHCVLGHPTDFYGFAICLSLFFPCRMFMRGGGGGGGVFCLFGLGFLVFWVFFDISCRWACVLGSPRESGNFWARAVFRWPSG
jgi:hypothetical protein